MDENKTISTVDGLHEVLTSHVELHKLLLLAADEKRDAVVRGDLEKMESLLTQEQRIVEEVEKYEKRRLEIIQALCGEYDVSFEGVKLADLLEKMPEKDSARISTVRNELRGVLDKLRYRNRQNCELLKASVQHANDFMRLIQNAVGGGELYGRNGKKAGGVYGLLNKRA